MSVLGQWFEQNVGESAAPLFAEHDSAVDTFLYNGVRKLRRNDEFDALMISKVERGLQDEGWLGLVYVLFWRRRGAIAPLYVAKADRRGRTNPISFNLQEIRTNDHAFGRWGYSLDYHIGDLSHAMFGANGYRAPSPQYEHWANVLFRSIDPPVLKERVFVAMFDVYNGTQGPLGVCGSATALKNQIIALAKTASDSALLNVRGGKPSCV